MACLCLGPARGAGLSQTVEPPQCLWSRPHERERGEREAQPADPQISLETPPSLHPQGPVHPEARWGARESRLCPGCWPGGPPAPCPARLACSTQRAGFQLGEGSPDLGGWKEVLPPPSRLLWVPLSSAVGPPSAPRGPLRALDALLVASTLCPVIPAIKGLGPKGQSAA